MTGIAPSKYGFAYTTTRITYHDLPDIRKLLRPSDKDAVRFSREDVDIVFQYVDANNIPEDIIRMEFDD